METMTRCSESRLAELIDTYGKLVFSICYKITGDYFTAEDITQETFLSVFQKYATFDGNNEKSWICRIATNKSIDFLRSAGRKGVPTEDEFFEGVVEKRGTDETGKEYKKQLEIDFVANLGSKRYYIQSAFSLPDDEKRAQEKASLINVNDSFKKIIIVKDVVKPLHDNDGILTMSIYDFLLNEHSLEL